MSIAQIVLFFLLAIICITNAFNWTRDKYALYGRACNTVKCPPYELCVLAEDECSFGQLRQLSCGTYPICGKLTLTDDCPSLSDPFWEMNGKISLELQIACHHLADYLRNSKNNEPGQENAASTQNIFSSSLIIIIITSIRNLWIVFT